MSHPSIGARGAPQGERMRLRLGGLLLGGGDVGEHAHDVALLHDQELLAVDLDLGARPLAEQHAVADLDVDRDQLAALVAAVTFLSCERISLRVALPVAASGKCAPANGGWHGFAGWGCFRGLPETGSGLWADDGADSVSDAGSSLVA